MNEFFNYTAYATSLMPRPYADEVFLLARRVMYLTNIHSTDFVTEEERISSLRNLCDVASDYDFIKQYKKIQKDVLRMEANEV